MRSERYFKIPLCQRDCDAWFEDCKFDYTCRDNWNKGFKWVNGIFVFIFCKKFINSYFF